MTHGQIARIVTTVEAHPGPGMTLDDLIVHMAHLGNRVVEVDRVHNCLVLTREVTEPPRG